jgi:hypothetical protein
MKKLLISLLVGLSCRAAYSDTKISAMTSTTTLNAGDVIPVVTNPTGSAANMKITKTNLITTLGIGSGGVSVYPATATASFPLGAEFSTMTVTNGIYSTFGGTELHIIGNQIYPQSVSENVIIGYGSGQAQFLGGSSPSMTMDAGAGFYSKLEADGTSGRMATCYNDIIGSGLGCQGFKNNATSNGTSVFWALPITDSAGCFKSDGSGNVSISACSSGGVVVSDSPTWTGTHNWTNAQFSTFTRLNITYNLNAGSVTGSGLSTCGDSAHGLGYNSTTGLFSCQNITGSVGGVAAGDSPTWTGVHNWSNSQASTFTALTVGTVNIGTALTSIGTSTGTLYTLANGKVNYASFTVTNPLTYNNTTGAFGIAQISLSTGVTGTLPSASLVSTVPFTTSTNTWSGGNSFRSSSTFVGAVVVSSSVLLSNSPGTANQVLTSAGPNAIPTWNSNPGTWLTGNQSITLSGAVSGSGATSITTAYVGNIPSSVLPSTVPFTTSTNTWSGGNTYNSSTTFKGAVVISTSILLSNSPGTSGQVIQSGGTNALASWATLTSAALSSTQTWTGGNTFTSSSTFIGDLVIPKGAAPTVDAIGEVAWDTTDGQLITYDGVSEKVVGFSTHCISVNVSSGTGYAGFNEPIWTAPPETAITITQIKATSLPIGTTVLFQLDETASLFDTAGTDVFSVAYSSAIYQTATTTSFANSGIAAGASLVLNCPAAAATGGTPRSLFLQICYTRNRE